MSAPLFRPSSIAFLSAGPGSSIFFSTLKYFCSACLVLIRIFIRVRYLRARVIQGILPRNTKFSPAATPEIGEQLYGRNDIVHGDRRHGGSARAMPGPATPRGRGG